MRTTLTLEDDLAAHVRKMVQESGKSFKTVINEPLRKGIAGERAKSAGQPYKLNPIDLGEVIGPENLDKALQLAADLEDEEIARTQANRSVQAAAPTMVNMSAMSAR